MTPTSPNAGYRRVLFSRCPLKTKLAALSRMPAPSAALLTVIIRDPNAHPKLKLLAADRLAELMRKREIDRVLKAESQRVKK